MTMVTFSEIQNTLVAFEDGQALACPCDPRTEALKWTYSLGQVPSSQVVVVGLGSGFHIETLADMDPDVKITVVDSRVSLISVFRSQFPELADRVDVVIAENTHDLMNTDVYADVVANRAFVISFRECWGNQVDLFSQFFAHLTGRSPEGVKYHFADIGMNLKSTYFNSAQLLTIKDILPAVEASQSKEDQKQIFRVLGELVK